jgi:trehalose 6-phosphate synthase/phosphatase
MAATQDSPAKVPDGQPNPVMVGPGMKSLGEEAYTNASNATPSLETDKKHPLVNDAPSYFSQVPGTKQSSTVSDTASPGSPADAAKNAKSPIELLRRLSLGRSPMIPDFDPREQYPGLNLTGRIISAAFCIPYKAGYRPGSDWVWCPHDLSTSLSPNLEALD